MKASPFWPAEWAAQDGVLIAWPHAGTDWADNLADVERTYAALATAISRRQRLLICVADGEVEARMRQLATAAGADLDRIQAVRIDYDDTWLRDSGPISLVDGNGFLLLDFRFTGWGGKFEASRDDALVTGLFERGVFSLACRHESVDFALEGGAVETDGQGSLLSTWHCLATRHPDKTREQVEKVLARQLRIQRFLWLENGALQGDDTDAHIDTLARFVSPDTIVFQGCDDPMDPHHAGLAAMADELASLRRPDGQPYRLFALPWAQPIHAAEGRRLAASYANFLIVNGAILMPGYGDQADAAAARVLQEASGLDVEIVPCRPLIEQNGSLHCITMQLPRGVLADV
ncbi:agmatine deiminase family protein [Pseudofulvimonas gallinarii]|uniref:Agmatine/peptidylarginine deiminase n=1 Tax=Pseudofulvimonas gallinarii TaxID=634155 RepID=A0A4S3L2K5_9GAMM|nr:agmatine deiminase family protein [Pseudofulvimonas gallinarii]TCT01272.1 agmatine/peptidylarginine deiminase [Pseudofulvimonas gallinarii]THD15034.1 agmatine deiminase [Pseudofulvimonas gallinarii]